MSVGGGGGYRPGLHLRRHRVFVGHSMTGDGFHPLVMVDPGALDS